MAIAVGKKSNGKVYHQVVGAGKNNWAACDKRTFGLVVDANLKAEAITCSKCLKRKDVKAALEVKPKKEIAKEPKDKSTIGIPAQATTTKKTTSKKKTTTTTTTAVKAAKEPAKTKPVAAPETKEPVEDFILLDDKKTGRYKIKHSPSGKTFFDGIPEDVVLEALEALNSIEERWSGREGSLPFEFVHTCRRCLRDAYKAKELDVPKSLKDIPKRKGPKLVKDPDKGTSTRKFRKGERLVMNDVLVEFDGAKWVPVKEEEPVKIKRRKSKPVKIKRRKTKDPERLAEEIASKVDPLVRPIKRRKEKVVKIKRRTIPTIAGRRKGTPGFTIVQAMVKGMSMKKIIAKVVEEHGLSDNKARAKLKTTIRILRRQDALMTIDMKKRPAEDVYHLRLGGKRKK